MLFWGDDNGDIHIMEFKTPVTQLFEKAFTKQQTKQTKNRIYMFVSRFNDKISGRTIES